MAPQGYCVMEYVFRVARNYDVLCGKLPFVEAPSRNWVVM